MAYSTSSQHTQSTASHDTHQGMANNIKIFYWHARGIMSHKEELRMLLKDVDIFVCTESWLKPTTNFQIPGYITYRKDRNERMGGDILVLLKKNIAFKENTNLKIPDGRVELCCLEITNTSPPLQLNNMLQTSGF